VIGIAAAPGVASTRVTLLLVDRRQTWLQPHRNGIVANGLGASSPCNLNDRSRDNPYSVVPMNMRPA
jgi:hypothetical protein